MTIYIDPYHTSAGLVLDMTKVMTPLKESTVRDPLDGTSLGVRPANAIIPVFITGCRSSEREIPSFAHPILIKNISGKSYLFTDMTLFVSSGGTLQNINSHIRRKEEFEFTRARAIASLAWASGDVSRFANSMGFISTVFASLITQSLSKYFALIFTDTMKIQMIALAYYESLFVEGAVNYSQNIDMSMAVARKASDSFKIPFAQAFSFYKQLDHVFMTANDMCQAIVKELDNVNLNPIQGKPGTEFNVRILLNLLANVWYSTNSKVIIPTALEHPPTFAAMVFYCLNYNNFRKQQLGQTIQTIGKGGRSDNFNKAFSWMLEEYTQPEQRIRPVMEYLDPATFRQIEDDQDASKIDQLLSELSSDDSEISKELN